MALLLYGAEAVLWGLLGLLTGFLISALHRLACWRAEYAASAEVVARMEPWRPAQPVTPAELRALWPGEPPPPARFDGEGGYN